MTQPRGAPAQSDQAAVPADRDDSTDHIICADGRVARGLGVASKLEDTAGATRGHADDPMRHDSCGMAAQQHIAADDLVGEHGGDRDRFAVADGGMHAGPLGAEPHGGTDRQGLFDHRREQVGVSHWSGARSA